MEKLSSAHRRQLWFVIGGVIFVTFAFIMNYILEGYELGPWIDLIFPAALAVLVLFGAYCIVIGLWPKTSRKFKWVLIGSAGFLLLIYVLQYVSATIVGDWVNNYDCPALYRVATAQHVIPRSVSVPNRFAMFCDTGQQGLFRTRYEEVTVYGVIELTEQSKVIGALTSYHVANNSLPIRVGFYEAENWMTWNNPATGASGGTRGPEHLIRVVVIR